jgi:Phage tail lysozyme
MAIGGPVYAAEGFFKNIARTRHQAQQRARQQLADSLMAIKEEGAYKENIIKEKAAYEKARLEAISAKNDHDLLQKRRAEIMASPGKPFKDAGIEKQLSEAHDKAEYFGMKMQQHQASLMDMVRQRNEAVDEPKIPEKMGGRFGFFKHDTTPEERETERKRILGSKEYGEGYAARQEKARNTPEGQAFEKELAEERKGLASSELAGRQATSAIKGLGRQMEEGRAQQSQLNEESRLKEIGELDQREMDIKNRQDVAEAGMSAAAEQLGARQQEQSQIEAQPGFQRALGGATTGKGGGGPIGGLLGALLNKGGGIGQGQGMGAPGAPQAPGGMLQAPGGAPTVAQAVGPLINRVAQMPLPQAARLTKAVLGGIAKPQFGGSDTQLGPPRRPVEAQPPSVELSGRGGGLTPQATMMADREALGKLGYNPNAQAAILGNIRQESNFRPRDVGDSGTAHGQFQWRGDRWGKEQAYARSKGLDPYSPASNIGFMDQEVSAIPGLKERLNRMDPASGAMLFGKMFERPRVVEPSRARYAQEFARGGSAPTAAVQSHESDYPKLNIPSSGGPSQQAEMPSEQGQQAARQEPQQQADGGSDMPRMPAPEPDTPPRPIDIKPFAPQEPQQQQQPQQAPGQGVSLPRVQSPDDIKKLKLQPGHGFIGPDGQVHWVPFPGREQAT